MKPVLAVRHVPHEGLGTISGALARRSVAVTTCDALTAPNVRFNPRDYSGLVVMGGPMNVDEIAKYPALANEVLWLKQAVDAKLPVLGVCLGAQLLAKALGSRVYANRVKEIGWYEVELLPAAVEDRLFRDLSRRSRSPAQMEREKLTVFQWHGDTFDLPAGAVQLARSSLCENQAFRCGEAAYGLQFHMEVTAEIIDSWLCQSDNCGELAGLPYIDPAAIRRETPTKLPAMTALGAVVFDRFAELCAAHG